MKIHLDYKRVISVGIDNTIIDLLWAFLTQYKNMSVEVDSEA